MDFKRIKEKIKKEPRVAIIRHGSTFLNNPDKTKDRIRGWLDVPLTQEGKDDAEKAAKKLQGCGADIIYSSDLIRAQQTAEIVDKAVNDVPIVVTRSLRPWGIGVYEGKISADVYPVMEGFIKHPDNIPEDGESFNTFRIRYLTILNRIMCQAKEENQVLLISTHYRNLKMACAWIDKGMPADLSISDLELGSGDYQPGSILDMPMKDFKR